jgi:ankyrin repeat protein
MFACVRGSLETVKLLVEWHIIQQRQNLACNQFLDIQNNNGTTALMLASMHGNKEIITVI